MKTTEKYKCNKCHQEYNKWFGQCKGCEEWSTISIYEPIESEQIHISRASTPIEIDFKEITNITPLKRNNILVIGGEPGIGKSTLVAQICLRVKSKVLYCIGEEAADSVKDRISRISNNKEHDNVIIEHITYIESIKASLARHSDISLLIVDSIHTLRSNASTSILHICESIREIASEFNIALILTSHITKEGIIAGPKTIEHMVDVVMYLEGERDGIVRTLRSVKNRLGPTNEVSMFEMTATGLIGINSQNRFSIVRSKPVCGAVLCPINTNSQIIIIEVQALVVKDSFGTKDGGPRVEVYGYNTNKVRMLLGVLVKWCSIKLSFTTVHIKVMGGVYVDDSGVELAICAAVLSSYFNVEIPFNLLFYGEVSLTGDIGPYEARKVNSIQGEYKIYANVTNERAVCTDSIVKLANLIKNYKA